MEATLIQSWFESGRIFDIVLAVLILEGLMLGGYWVWTRRGLAPMVLLPFLLSGGFLVAAFRAAMLDAAWLWSALFLTLAFAVHLLELKDRWLTSGVRAGVRE